MVILGGLLFNSCSSSTGSSGGGDLAVQLTAPTNKASGQSTDLKLTWSGSGLVYDLYLGSAADNLAKEGETSGKEFSPDGLTCNTTYYWQVVAKNESSQKASDIWSFTTDAELRVSLSSPDNNQVVDETENITLRWGGNAESYDLYVGTDKDDLQLEYEGWKEKSYFLDSLKAGERYYWKVVANGKSESIESSVQAFITKGGSTIYIISPEDGDYNSNVRCLVWSDEDGYSYTIKCGTSLDSMETFYTDAGSYSREFRPKKTYYWCVSGTSDYGDKSSDTVKFHTKDQPKITLDPVDDDDEQVSLTPYLDWNGTNVSSYTVYLGTSADNMDEVASGLTTSNKNLVDQLLPNQQYYWKVVGTDDNGNKVESEVGSFKTVGLVTLSAPTDNADQVSVLPELSWSGVGVSSYTVWLGKSSDDMDEVASGSSGTSYSPDEQLDYNQTYYWQVVGTDADGKQVKSEVRSFTTELGTYTNSINMQMVMVKAGNFQMGSEDEDAFDREKPVHSVTISQDYYIGKYEVTNAQVVAVFNWAENEGIEISFSETSVTYGGNELLDLDGSLCQIGLSGGSLCVKNGQEYCPVVYISWYGAVAFADFLNQKEGVTKYSLPTEAQWEFAARGGNQSNGYTYAGSNNIDAVAWYTDNSEIRIREVGTKSPNELGIYDMSGSALEWCNDWYGDYPSEAVTDPVGASTGSYRIMRGGDWAGTASGCRVADRRYYNNPSYKYYCDGFRLICSP